MIFDELVNDIVTLVKQDGEIFNKIKANVQTKNIFINDASLPIEEGDTLIRELPNGLKEHYLVIDRGFYPKFHGIDAHYQVQVQKKTTREIENNRSTNNYHFNGLSEKINVNSIDNSININNDKELFINMRAALKDVPKDNSAIFSSINELESNVGKQSFKDSYNKFIQNSANHMNIIAPFIPALTEILTKSLAK